jgi:hypothetical protein
MKLAWPCQISQTTILKSFSLLGILLISASLTAAEKVTVKLPSGQATDCEVVKVSKDGVTIKSQGKQQIVPLDKMDPKEVALCYKQVSAADTAASRFDMGSFFFKKQLFSEAEEELSAAVKLDGGLKTRAEPFLLAINALKEVKKPEGKNEIKVVKIGSPSEDSEQNAEDFENKFKKREVAARTPAEMKAFLDKRLEELKAIGGTWRLIETKHYYCFANVTEAKHQEVAQWNEGLYGRLCEVLRHKEGDKLWNNKMPIYYFEKYGQFQRFAAEIDGSPGAAYSGGYFFATGRDVHICIPFMTERFNNQKTADRMARNTLHHECTHAFLQLSGEDVPLNRWLHEGLAQFIEFWYDRENSQSMQDGPERKERADYLKQMVTRGNLPPWEKMKQRPMSGMDIEGYAFAWSKLEFLYRIFDNQKLPQFIKLIKSGKSEEDSFKTAFGFPADKLEEVYRTWLKDKAKQNMKF